MHNRRRIGKVPARVLACAGRWFAPLRNRAVGCGVWQATGGTDLADSAQQERQAQRRDAFERLALPLAPRLRAAARHWCSHPGVADDAVQETFLRAYRTFDSFRPGTNARAWLFTILHSVCANERERASFRGTLGLEEVPESMLSDGSDATGSASSLTDGEVARELDALAEPFRSAVVLVDLGELSYEEAARAAGCALGTMRSRLSRGRRALAAKLAHLAPRSFRGRP